jgi:hypothetical protein
MFIIDYSIHGKAKREKFEGRNTATYYANKLFANTNVDATIWFKDTVTGTIRRWTKEVMLESQV